MLLPPGLLIALVVQGAVVQAAERDGEGIAGLEAKAARLQELEVMGVRRQAPADEAGLLANPAQMRLIADPPRSERRKSVAVHLLSSLQFLQALAIETG